MAHIENFNSFLQESQNFNPLLAIMEFLRDKLNGKLTVHNQDQVIYLAFRKGDTIYTIGTHFAVDKDMIYVHPMKGTANFIFLTSRGVTKEDVARAEKLGISHTDLFYPNPKDPWGRHDEIEFSSSDQMLLHNFSKTLPHAGPLEDDSKWDKSYKNMNFEDLKGAVDYIQKFLDDEGLGVNLEKFRGAITSKKFGF